MCFSATASFTASAALGMVSALAFKQATNRATRMLAFSPFMFAAQQAAEGFLWLSFTNPAWQHAHIPATYFFLFCALAWWPLWVPLTMSLLEKNILRKKLLTNLLAFGALFSSYMLFCLFYYGSGSELLDGHIYYDFDIPGHSDMLFGAFYYIPAVIPFFLSTVPNMNLLGAAVTIAYITTYIFYRLHFLSVWCFFAAMLSIMILDIVHRLRRQQS